MGDWGRFGRENKLRHYSRGQFHPIAKNFKMIKGNAPRISNVYHAAKGRLYYRLKQGTINQAEHAKKSSALAQMYDKHMGEYHRRVGLYASARKTGSFGVKPGSRAFSRIKKKKGI